MQESGCKLDHPSAAKFQSHVIDGEWQEAEQDLLDLQHLLSNPQALLEMKFLLLEQKFLEFLDENKVMEALVCLRDELAELKHRTDRIHDLSGFLMCSSPEDLRRMSGWEGRGAVSRQKLMEKLQGESIAFFAEDCGS